jgi:hypothetical protein
MSSLRFVLIAIVLLSPGSVRAQQPAQSFDQLALLIVPGDKVTVTDASGREMKGRFLGIEGTRLRMSYEDGARVFEAAEVRRVDKRQSDSMLNGTLIGLGIGAAFAGVAWASICADDGCDGGAGWIVASVALYGAAGAGVGALIDALVTKKHTLYRAAGSTSVSLAPVITPKSQRVLLTVRF